MITARLHASVSVLILAALARITCAQEAAPPTSIPLDQTLVPVFENWKAGKLLTEEAYSNFRLVLEYDSDREARVSFGENADVSLPAGKGRRVETAYEHVARKPARIRVWQDGQLVEKGRDLASAASPLPMSIDREASSETLKFDGDFTAMIRFRPAATGGTLISKCLPDGKWVKNAKALFLRGDRMVYDIGWLGSLEGKSKVAADKDHLAVLVCGGGELKLFLDGRLEASRKAFTAADPEGSVFKIGAAAEDFGGSFKGGIGEVRYWRRALDGKEIKSLSTGNISAVNTPDFDWSPGESGTVGPETRFGEIPGFAIRPVLESADGFKLHSGFVQPLATADHSALVAGWGDDGFKRGDAIYQQLCVTCHGTLDAPGSLPTSPQFHLADFKNGDDPYRMLQTLDKGYGLMVPQPQYTTAQKYELIHYIREDFLREGNKKHYVPVDEDYIAKLPRGMTLLGEEQQKKELPRYMLKDFGNVLFWTLQVDPGNIAQKGIAVRVDDGPGGVSKGNAWMLYEHDTMRLAACWTGDKFVDWRGIAFDGSHGSHTSIVGDKKFVFPNEPMWSNPETGDFKDLRILGRDGLPYGPLPRGWVRFKGVEIQGQDPVIRYSIGDCEIREVPALGEGGSFERRFYCGPSSSELKLKLNDEKVHVIPAGTKALAFVVRYHDGGVEVVDGSANAPAGKPVSKRFDGTLVTRLKPGSDEGPWAVDVLELPEPDKNPWQSWMRTTGFDFFEGGSSAAICTWNGDVWIVDGIDQKEGELKWQRICSGLFQPLGLKILDGEIYVGCRDMIAILRDLDGDRETDFIESFNSDHQVTEHFHEFAMGLQADDEGNLYYAKSARHAKTAVVPHHGTLLKVASDGGSTEILATGFRAANGVCLNPDGSFMVTDQEGNWNPKNRINWVKGNGGFYGNIWGYHSVTDESDTAMNQPLCWITNSFDRSPAELLWVPEDSAWTSMRGSLLNLSYGAGQIYSVPFEKVGDEVQGGMAAFPLDLFPTGVMRGRFSPADGQLYGCGMFAWAGNRHQPGGFYRVRYTGKPAHQPIALTTDPGTLTIGFTDPLDKASVEDVAAWKLKAWDLERTSNYGSKHLNERSLEVSKAVLSKDGKSVALAVPELAPTWGMSIEMKLRGSHGEVVERQIHNSIFKLE